VISLIMVNPFVLLPVSPVPITPQSSPERGPVRGVREGRRNRRSGRANAGPHWQRANNAPRQHSIGSFDFAAVASHELRTPLTAMRTNLEVLSTLELAASSARKSSATS